MQKSFSSFNQIYMIHAYVASGSAFHKIRVPAAHVNYLQDISETETAIVLHSGEKICVAMPAEALEQKIFQPTANDDYKIDLLNVTGPGYTGGEAPALTKEFNKTETKNLADSNVELTIAMFVRKSETQNFQMFTCSEKDIDWGAIDCGDGKNGPITLIPLKDKYKTPFKENPMIVDILDAKFMELYSLAKMNGGTQLDLRDLTRKRDPNSKKKPG